MRTLISDMKNFAEAVKSLAFKMPPPNEFTPQFVMLAQAAERIAQEHEDIQRAQYRKLIRSLSPATEHK